MNVPAEEDTKQSAAQPTYRYCDLVMRGGITSGVVYPKVVIKLANADPPFFFRSIGGTSAGAIVAALTAAAERGRRAAPLNTDNSSYIKLDTLLETLAESGFLANLFQPCDEARPLLNTFMGWLEAESNAKQKANNNLQEVDIPLLIPPQMTKGYPDPQNVSPQRIHGGFVRVLFRFAQYIEKSRARRATSPTKQQPAQHKRSAVEIASTLLALLTVAYEREDNLPEAASAIPQTPAPTSGALGFIIGLAERVVKVFAPRLHKAGATTAAIVSLVIWIVFAVVALVSASAILLLSPALLGKIVIGWLAALIILGGISFWIGGQIGVVLRVLSGSFTTITNTIPNNLYGICTGNKNDRHADGAFFTPAPNQNKDLITWLSESINALAGQSDEIPLTFGDLQNAALLTDEKKGVDEPTINLQMVSSNLSERQPYILPFERPFARRFLFSKKQMLMLFPGDVVKHLCNHAYGSNTTRELFQRDETQDILTFPIDSNGDGSDDDELRILPLPEQLPVVVAMRMSMSFPILLSAVPLWTIKQSVFAKQEAIARDCKQRKVQYTPYKLQQADLDLHWFSDGGICSNFPIHFFDRLLPPYPTFGINLDDLRPGDANDIILPKPNQNSSSTPRWQATEDLSQFLGSMFDTSRNYRDNMQSQLPTYADRTVTIRLDNNQGGLNLNMDQHTINDIVDKGERAGNKLLQEFNLDHHQWTRLRLLINELSKQARIVRGDLAITLPEADWNNIKHNLRVALTPLEGASTNVVRELIIKEWEARYPSEGQPKPFPYPSDTTSQVNLLNPSESLRLNLLLALIAIWGEEHTKHEPFFGGEKPSTERVRLRITPTL